MDSRFPSGPDNGVLMWANSNSGIGWKSHLISLWYQNCVMDSDKEGSVDDSWCSDALVRVAITIGAIVVP
jgi:hypothetical protein